MVDNRPSSAYEMSEGRNESVSVQSGACCVNYSPIYLKNKKHLLILGAFFRAINEVCIEDFLKNLICK